MQAVTQGCGILYLLTVYIYLPVGSTVSLMIYDTVSSVPVLVTILTEWFPAGLTLLVITIGRVPVERHNYVIIVPVVCMGVLLLYCLGYLV